MFEYMENVSPNEAENIKKTIQDLFRQTCILQMKCDPVTLIQRDILKLTLFLELMMNIFLIAL